MLKPSALLKDPMDTFHPSYLDEIANAIRGPAVQAVIDMRIEQIVRHGHDAEHDADLPLDWLPREAGQRLTAVLDRIRGTGTPRNLPAARLGLVRAAAMCLAAIDRLDAEAGAQAALDLGEAAE